MNLTNEEFGLLYVKANQLDPPFASLSISINPCLITNPSCLTNYNLLRGIGLMTLLPKSTFDPENRQEPVTTIGSTGEFLRIDYRLSKTVNIYLKSVELFDDKYDFFEETLKKKYAMISTTSS